MLDFGYPDSLFSLAPSSNGFYMSHSLRVLPLAFSLFGDPLTKATSFRACRRELNRTACEKLKTCDVWHTAVNSGRLSNPDALGPSIVVYELWLEAHRPLIEDKSPR